jgi:hypothetical protein
MVEKAFDGKDEYLQKSCQKKGNLKSTKCEQKDFQFASKIIKAVWGNKFSLIKSTIPVLPTITIFFKLVMMHKDGIKIYPTFIVSDKHKIMK